MKSFLLGALLGYGLHWMWIWCRHRVTFTTTGYTTNSGKTSYVSYTFPKNLKVKNPWPFKKSEEVFAKRNKKRRHK